MVSVWVSKVDSYHLPLIVVPPVRLKYVLLITIGVCVTCLDSQKVPGCSEPVEGRDPFVQKVIVEVVFLVLVVEVDSHHVGTTDHGSVFLEVVLATEQWAEEWILKQVKPLLLQVEFFKCHFSFDIDMEHHCLH